MREGSLLKIYLFPDRFIFISSEFQELVIPFHPSIQKLQVQATERRQRPE
jgi:hypothetical protein